MILRNQVEWALHCCTAMALQPTQYVSTKQLAEFHGVPKEYLSKALQALASSGLLEATLGPTGGYRLSRPSSQISFLDVVEAIEGKKVTFECTEIRTNNPCLNKAEKKMTNICEIARVMYRADEAWRKELRGKSIEALANELKEKLSPDILQRNADWFAAKK
jgi:Rrf2 family protein